MWLGKSRTQLIFRFRRDRRDPWTPPERPFGSLAESCGNSWVIRAIIGQCQPICKGQCSTYACAKLLRCGWTFFVSLGMLPSAWNRPNNDIPPDKQRVFYVSTMKGDLRGVPGYYNLRRNVKRKPVLVCCCYCFLALKPQRRGSGVLLGPSRTIEPWINGRDGAMQPVKEL